MKNDDKIKKTKCWIDGQWYQFTHEEFLKDIELFIGGATDEEWANHLRGKEYYEPTK